MRRPRSPDRAHPWSEVLDGWFFALSGVTGIWFAYVLLRDGVRPGWPTLLLLVFWAFFSYLVLPRLHRILTWIYLPGYFVGRTRTSDGLLGDPVNLGFRGTEAQIHAALRAAGWTRADELDARSAAGIVRSVLSRGSYAAAPVSPLHLFDRVQDFAYEQEVAGSASRRHHIRFWRCPEGWLLPGGFRTDWMAAATYDRGVGLSLFTLQITHRIEEDTDLERDFVVSAVCATVPEAEVSVIENFSTGYHHRNGGGDRIRTDGDLPIVDLRRAVPPVGEPAPAERRARIPQQVLVGAGVVLTRATTYGVLAVLAGVEGVRSTGLATAVAIVAAAEIGLTIAYLGRRDWARLVLVAGSSVTAVATMVDAMVGSGRPVGLTQLLAVAGGILVLLALSSTSAREFATGRPDLPDRPGGRHRAVSR